MVYERVYHEAGARTQMHLPYRGLVDLIRGAGKRPVERDSFYQAVREDFDDLADPLGADAAAHAIHAA